MRQKLISLLALLSFMPLCATQYVGIEGGANHSILTNHSDADLKTGLAGSIKYGYKFASGIRVELQAIYRTNRFKTKYNLIDNDQIASKEYKSHHSWSYMSNVIYDICQLSTYEIVPYIGAGIGYCQLSVNHKVKSDAHTIQNKIKDSRFAYHAIAGAKYKVQENMETGIEYRYFIGNNHKKDHSVAMFVLRTF
jgi:outer membrane autotransporter protein